MRFRPPAGNHLPTRFRPLEPCATVAATLGANAVTARSVKLAKGDRFESFDEMLEFHGMEIDAGRTLR